MVTDWQEASNTPGGDDGDDKDDNEKTKPAGGVIALRLGQVAHERDGDGTRTSLYCVTWAVQGTTVVSMADQQVVAAPWRSGAADPAAAAGVLADSCRGL